MNKSVFGLAFVGMGISLCVAAYAADPAAVCESSKLGTSGKYAQCRLKAEAKSVKTGESADYSKCTLAKFADAETKAGMNVCPTEGDQASVQDFLDACSASVAVALDGGILPIDVLTCNEDLATCGSELSSTNSDLGACNTDLSATDADLTTCEGDLSTTNADLTTCDGDLVACQAQPQGNAPKTGQVTCWDPSDTLFPIATIPCAGSGQDGETQHGLARSFVDNGDGTISDENSGLMWEKLSDDGSIHDKDSVYTWANAFATKIATLNAMSFAGYDDWRLPNIIELETLRNFGALNPSVYSPFNVSCVASCDVSACSCTLPNNYWSSTSEQQGAGAWIVAFFNGEMNVISKPSTAYVRAVRGGS